MKTKVLLSVLFLLLCTSSLDAQKGKERVKVIADTVAVDSTEYELIVLDPGFESWLQMKPENLYSEEYYRARNILYVREWNYRFMNQIRYGGMYESYIDYRDDIDYGKEFNYRLYYYFKYFEEVNHVTLLPGHGRE